MTHDNVESCLDISDEGESVLDIDTEFSLEGIVDMDGSCNITVSIFISKVSLESNRYVLPTSRIVLSESLPNHLDNPLRCHTRLLYQNKGINQNRMQIGIKILSTREKKKYTSLYVSRQ